MMTTQDQALIPRLLIKKGNLVSHNMIAVLFGIALLSLLAQVSIPLPFTPVPITGQTFGVALTALLWGRKRAVACVVGYLGLGAAGVPVFAAGSFGLAWGPTLGYLIGMLIASFAMGTLADRGWTKTFFRSWLAAFSGSLITFACGLLVLSFFVPREALLMAGLLPFIPGDIVKTLLASGLAYKSSSLPDRL